MIKDGFRLSEANGVIILYKEQGTVRTLARIKYAWTHIGRDKKSCVNQMFLEEVRRGENLQNVHKP